MKRSLDLYRDILLAVESSGTPWDHEGIIVDIQDGFNFRGSEVSVPDSLRETKPEILTRHAQLLIQAGLLEGDAGKDSKGVSPVVSIFGLTHEGHDFVENIRDNTVWKKVKEKAASMALEVVKATAKAVVKGTAGV